MCVRDLREILNGFCVPNTLPLQFVGQLGTMYLIHLQLRIQSSKQKYYWKLCEVFLHVATRHCYKHWHTITHNDYSICTGTSTNISDQVSWFMKEKGLHELFAYFCLVLIYYCINKTIEIFLVKKCSEFFV